ncbi:TlpA family protein disulfide reductase [Intestinibacter sp.]
MNSKKVIYIGIAIVLLMFVGKLGYDYLSNAYLEKQNNISVIDESNVVEEGPKKADDFTVYDKDGNKVSLSDYIGKKNVVVNFWASWCPPCKAEMPYFEGAMKKYKDEDVEILMVNLTDGMRETKETANEFLKSEGYDMNVVYDFDGDAVFTYYLNSIPRTLFIDIDGNLVYDHSGLISESALNDSIEQLLN